MLEGKKITQKLKLTVLLPSVKLCGNRRKPKTKKNDTYRVIQHIGGSL